MQTESGLSAVDCYIDSEEDTPADKAGTVGWVIAVHKSDTVEVDRHN